MDPGSICRWCEVMWRKKSQKRITLQGINISHLGNRKIIFKMPFWGDMLVSRRVYIWLYIHTQFRFLATTVEWPKLIGTFNNMSCLTSYCSNNKMEIAQPFFKKQEVWGVRNYQRKKENMSWFTSWYGLVTVIDIRFGLMHIISSSFNCEWKIHQRW